MRLNPSIDLAAHAQRYARDGVVQVFDILIAEDAERLETAFLKATAWGLSTPGPDGKGEWLSPEALQALEREAVARKATDALGRARDGFSFAYLAYPMIEAYAAGRHPGHPSHAFLEFLNGPEMLDFARVLTGEAGLTKIDAQATLFRPNDYLTLHDDTGGRDERRAAYTFGLTRDWRADWGGQLLFHDMPGGDVIRGFKPGFNVLTVFRTPQWHSVAPVAPYAGRPRLSVTGWMRDDPIAG